MDDEIHVQVTVIFCEMVVCFMTLLSYEDFGKNLFIFWVRMLVLCIYFDSLSLSVTCGRSVVFSRYSGSHHDIAEILLKVVLKTLTLTIDSLVK
jgi:hypothetical protein